MATIDVQGESFDEERYRDRISAKAYEIWEAEGRPHGGHERHWDQARNIIQREVRQEDVAAQPRQEEAGNAEAPLSRSSRARRSRQPSTPE